MADTDSVVQPLDETPRTIRLCEFETEDIPLAAVWRDGRLDMYPNLEGKGYFQVVFGKTTIRLQAKGHVGIIPVNDRLTLEIVPRVPLGNLSRLLEVARKAPQALTHTLRLYEAGGEMYPSLAVIYAAALRGEVERIVDQGMLKDYYRLEELTSFPRGRLNLTSTMQRAAARGITHRAASAWFQRTVDNDPNRCLLYAVSRLSQYVERVGEEINDKQRRRAQLDLNYCGHHLSGVELDWSERFLLDGRVTGRTPLPPLRSYYRAALDLALLVIGRKAVRLERTDAGVQLPSLLVNLTEVFEAYVRQVLMRAARADRWDARVLDGNLDPPAGGSGGLFDPLKTGEEGIRTKATPDVVIKERDNDRCLMVLEVKYKPAERLGDGRYRDDLNQAISYGVAFDAPLAVLVQPRATGSRLVGLHRLGRVAGTTVYSYVVDLESGDLTAVEQRFHQEVRTLISSVT